MASRLLGLQKNYSSPIITIKKQIILGFVHDNSKIYHFKLRRNVRVIGRCSVAKSLYKA